MSRLTRILNMLLMIAILLEVFLAHNNSYY